MKTQIEIFYGSLLSEVVQSVNVFLDGLHRDNCPITDIKFSSDENAFNVMVIYQS